jgi:hypothetical protein
MDANPSDTAIGNAQRHATHQSNQLILLTTISPSDNKQTVVRELSSFLHLFYRKS